MRKNGSAFSLLEVVLAVGLFALGLVGVVALFTPTARIVDGRGAAARTARLVHAVRLELERFRAAVEVAPDVSPLDQLAAAIGDEGLRLVADRNGERLELENGGGLPPRERYHLILVERRQGALAHQDGAGFLALTVSVRWPYRLPLGENEADSIPASAADAEFLTFGFALTP